MDDGMDFWHRAQLINNGVRACILRHENLFLWQNLNNRRDIFQENEQHLTVIDRFYRQEWKF